MAWRGIGSSSRPGGLRAKRNSDRAGSRSPVISKAVNGFIAFGPIPGWRGAASCRPPRSWRLGRRSGRVPAWRYPPPRLLQQTPSHGPRPFTGDRLGTKWGGRMPQELQRQRRIEYQDPQCKEDGRRGEIQANVVCCSEYIYIYKFSREDRPRRDRDHLRPPICPATFGNQTFAPSRERPPQSRGARAEVIGPISDTAN